ncbi:MAG: tetratricopeptide repeat protein [Cyanobacteria bacterium REEB459]|nr:tetratricopeptide repeat protein [Cyanobacteria bacterium REEB459]
MVVKRLLNGRFQFIRAVSTKRYIKTYLMLDQNDLAKGKCIVKRLQLPAQTPTTLKVLRSLLDKRLDALDRLKPDPCLEKKLATVWEGEDFYWIRGYVPGQAFAQELASGQADSENQVRDFLVEVLTILDRLQTQGVVHQNLHPNNLIRRHPGGELVLVDFGLIQAGTPARASYPGLHNGKAEKDPGPEFYQPLLKDPGKPWSTFYPDHFALGMMALQLATGLSQEALPQAQQLDFSGQIKLQLDECSVLTEALKTTIITMIDPAPGREFLRAQDILTVLGGPQGAGPNQTSPGQLSPADQQSAPEKASEATVLPPISDQNSNSTRAETPTREWGSLLSRRPGGKVGLLITGLLMPPVLIIGLWFGLQLPQRWQTMRLSRQAHQQEEKGDVKAAIASLDEIMTHHPNHTPTLVYRSQLLQKSGQSQKALADLNQAIEGEPASARLHFLRGNLQLDLGDLQGAMADYSQTLELDPNYSEAYLNRGNARADLGDESGAVEDYTQVLNRTQNTKTKALAHLNRCLSRSNLGDQTGGMADCSAAINLQPGNGLAYGNRGLVKRRLEDFKGALQDFTIAIQLHPDNPEPYYNRGLTRQGLGDLRGAMVDFNQTIKINPDHPFAYYDRGLLHAALGETQAAVADLEKVASRCLNLGRTDCFKDAQYQLQRLKQRPTTNP